jgi:hypothetical protein
MKLIILLSLLSTTTIANDTNKRFEARKSSVLSHMDKRIALIQEGKSCVQAATSRDALKSCRTSQKEKTKLLKEERKKFKQQMKKERKKNRKAQ